ncbi:MAG TPA: Clp1/GlmU family protein [Sedimentisphaerales bacterium]|nr:Clp1/GlmU family protein [Sedimentisphaerales bacterium]
MSPDWADRIAERLLNEGFTAEGVCLVLGASDTGKTTLIGAMARRIASRQPVAIVDADIGQSHLGPPTTVGWAVVANAETDLEELGPAGISFVGDVTPLGHLLQLTAAVVQCVRQASDAAPLVLIDTPGLVRGPAAAALWWTLQRVLQPEQIIAVQRSDELGPVLSGLNPSELRLDVIECPPDMPVKSPEHRRDYRLERFRRYFRGSGLYDIDLATVAVQPRRQFNPSSVIHHLVALSDGRGRDLAVGLITDWRPDGKNATIMTPQLNVESVRCLVVGDVFVDVADLQGSER